MISANDYPAGALTRNEQGATFFQIVIRPDGNPDTCSVLISSGYRELDDTTCKLMLKRARFAPVQGSDGKAIYAVYRGTMTWAIDAPISRVRGADFDLEINRVPAGVTLPVEFKVSYFHGGNGSFGQCTAVEADERPPVVLSDLACKAVSQSPGDPIRNSQGQLVDAMDEALVKFSLKK